MKLQPKICTKLIVKNCLLNRSGYILLSESFFKLLNLSKSFKPFKTGMPNSYFVADKRC